MRPLLAFATALAAWTQFEGAFGLDWQDEVNVSMCNWAQLRANIIRDTLYLDGGDLWWQMGLSDGTLGVPQEDDGSDGLMYTFNLGQPFNQSTNLTGLFQGLSKTDGLANNNLAPDYIDGVMFANDDEFITYGGLVRETNSSSAPNADSALGYEAYEYGATRASWQPGFIAKDLPSGITRYVTNGAGVSAPSENMGYYFSGMRGADWGPIYDGDGSANTLADSLISVNMTVMRGETWANVSLPSSVPPRANAELVWLPVGEQGLLVAVGGVIDPESLTVVEGLNNSQATASMDVSPTFMETVSIYNVANQSWQLANTTGDIPPQLTLFCSVVAPAADNSSYNIYIYGGYNGINHTEFPSDDVYVLSVPQMIWTHAYTGQNDHGRTGHKCFRIYPDQMLIVGGVFAGNPAICLQGGITEVFNLNNLTFQDSYDPRVWAEYSVPDAITAKIGGTATGNATATVASSLSSLFAVEYSKPIPTYYPYQLVVANTTNTTTTTSTPSPTSITIEKNTGLPAWVGPVLGVVLGLIVIAAAAIIFLLWRRRKASKRVNAGASDTHTNASGIRGFVTRWLHGTSPQDEKGPGDIDIDGATAVSTKTPDLERPGHERHISEAGSVGIQEMDSPIAAVFEMDSSLSEHGVGWHETINWSQPQASPPLVSPNIDEMLGQDPLSPSAAAATSETTRRRHNSRYSRQRSERSDASNVSEIGSSDPGRPSHMRQTSDESVSDVVSNPASSSQGGGTATEVSSNFTASESTHATTATATATATTTRTTAHNHSRDQSAETVFANMRDRIQTVHEVDELLTPVEEPADDASRRQRNVTELE